MVPLHTEEWSKFEQLHSFEMFFLFGTEILTYQSVINGVVGGALGRSALLKYQKFVLVLHYIITELSETYF